MQTLEDMSILSSPKGSLAPRLHLSNVMKEVHWHREIRKYKAHLNAHGGHQIQGVSYWETFAPVVRWTTIQLLLVLILTHGWESRQFDFVLAYPQADI